MASINKSRIAFLLIVFSSLAGFAISQVSNPPAQQKPAAPGIEKLRSDIQKALQARPANCVQPTISAVEPAIVRPGDPVLIGGCGFSGSPGKAYIVRPNQSRIPKPYKVVTELVVTSWQNRLIEAQLSKMTSVSETLSASILVVTVRNQEALSSQSLTLALPEPQRAFRLERAGMLAAGKLQPIQGVAIDGYVRDANNNGLSNVNVVALPNGSGTNAVRVMSDTSGHYMLRVAAPFTGYVQVETGTQAPPAYPCLNCREFAKKLENQASDLSNLNFTCANTTRVVGRTTDQYNAIIKGVILNGLPGNPVTNDWGDYQAEVGCGWSGTVTPVKAGWKFTPASKTYSNLIQMPPRQDYIGTVNSFYIAGFIRTSSGARIEGVKMNGLPGSIMTDANGHYSVIVEGGWSGTVTPVKEDYSFNPTMKTYTSYNGSRFNEDYTGQ